MIETDGESDREREREREREKREIWEISCLQHDMIISIDR